MYCRVIALTLPQWIWALDFPYERVFPLPALPDGRCFAHSLNCARLPLGVSLLCI
jgi:hypothetical protein